ncbi:HK97 gp10 family phage protein [Clostridioides difficile]|uniref:HK97 gp10 family phage protein n=1 Tax=Clostridioides TaxID=1870884 RepID=UPI000D1F58FE|nr:HK97 gp10 family phage protein [Clostridioides difficile]MCC0627751.1 HK97 gp10 family phage protein [Clostridioides sp. ES-S-0171-01]MCC0689715.1 HK97 gp10 family phage protein [Clostridioides sp. ES-S-0056-01]MCC0716787.1 HK97 gp10 family phage protein [Clostridioides sp. ES-S-0077-01]EGT4532626.1 HK97 gp10 family phage protein [Clostridioides difficile]MBY2844435.1 HK97 gp10 family phage protein [Clostridioides difficile]
MSSTDFNTNSLDDYTNKLFKRIVKEYPKKAEKLMNISLGKCKGEAIARTPKSDKKPKKYKRAKHMKDNWKTKAQARNGNYTGVLKNDSPHAHLLENGWSIKNGGYIEGKHILQQTMEHQRAKIDKRIEKMVDETFNL